MIIGRQKEIAVLKDSLLADNSQFIAVYGRRRVGKTFLIREAFGGKFTFQHSGIANESRANQLVEWKISLEKSGFRNCPLPKNWFEAFALLDDLIKKSRARKKVVFIDELPWMDTPNSSFVSALEHFWNGYASARKDVVFVVCGSATSWIVGKILKNHGGLHNRITRKIHLHQFTLRECEEYSQAAGLAFSRRQIVECYMVMGGIPFYWSLLDKRMGLAQNIDNLFFGENALLSDEFDALYRSLFQNPEPYLKVVTALGTKRIGMYRGELLSECRLADNGGFSKVLDDLEYCGFIRKYNSIDKKSKDCIFQLTDFFTIFYFKFIKGNVMKSSNFWSSSMTSNIYHNWCGLAFEQVCLKHILQIKTSLGISGIPTQEFSWIFRDSESSGAQIDMLIRRSDNAIYLCEIKYSSSEFAFSEYEEDKLINRRAKLLETVGGDSEIHITLITPKGLKLNSHSNQIQNVVVMEDLFR